MANATAARKSVLADKVKRKAPEIVLLPNKKVKSDSKEIWSHFQLIEENGQMANGYTTCTHCKCILTYRNPNDPTAKNYGTSTLKTHLDRCSSLPKNVQNLPRNQPRIDGHAATPLTNAERLHLKRPETKFVCFGNHSMRSVENSGLVLLCQEIANIAARRGRSFDVSKELFKRKAIGYEIEIAATEVKQNLKAILVEPVSAAAVCLTSDMYTDDSCKRAYIDVHAFWIDKDLQFRHCLLAVRHFGTERHTGDNILLRLNEIFEEYGLKDKDVLVTTDMGSNMIAALRGQYGRIDCANHRLHTCFMDAWTKAKAAHATLLAYDVGAAKLCKYVKQATAIQEQLPKSLKHGGDTRPWTAIHRRATSLDESYAALRNVLTDERLLLLTAVKKPLNSALLPLTGFVAAMFKQLETAEHPTLHLVIPTYYKIAKACIVVHGTPGDHTKPGDLEEVKSLKRFLIEALDSKYFTSCNKATHWIATFLDPTFREFDFMPEDAFKRRTLLDIDEWLQTRLANIEQAEIDNRDMDADDALEVEDQGDDEAGEDPFSEMRRPLTSNAPVAQTTAEDELQRYKAGEFKVPPQLPADAAPAAKKDPLRFWRTNARSFPLMAKLVRTILSAPGSSATSERDFSSVGLTLTKGRSRLKPKRLEAIELVKAGAAFGLI